MLSKEEFLNEMVKQKKLYEYFKKVTNVSNTEDDFKRLIMQAFDNESECLFDCRSYGSYQTYTLNLIRKYTVIGVYYENKLVYCVMEVYDDYTEHFYQFQMRCYENKVYLTECYMDEEYLIIVDKDNVTSLELYLQ